MGADASIYSLIRPQQAQPGPLDQYAQGLQLRGLIDDQGLKQLQRQQLERGIQGEQATEDAYRQSKGDPVRLRELLYGSGQYKAAIAAEKAGLETEKMRGDIGKTKAETHKMHIASLRDRLAAVADDSQLAAAREEAMKLYGPQAVQSMPQTVNDPNFGAWREQQLMTADKLLERTAPKYSVEDFGGAKGVVQSNPLAAGGVSGLMAKTADPNAVLTDERTRSEGAANRGVTMRGQNMTDARSRESNANGRVPTGYRLAADGNLEPIPGGPATKLGEAQVKQEVGVRNTIDALGQYRDSLKNWKAWDALNPDARAKMGTVYNNALLQAKEAFNLGVLNGPDYSILQSVLTDPASLKGGIVSKEALNAQATKLEEIMGKIGTTVASQGKQQQAAPSPAKAVELPKLGAVVDGYIFKGGDPANQKNWEKAGR